MPTFAQQAALDAENVFNNPLEFGETITYIAKRPDHVEATAAPGSGDKTVRARVLRSDPNPGVSQSARPFPSNGVQFFVSKDSTLGITTVKERLDKVKIALKSGGTAIEMRVVKILSEGFGMWHLEAVE